MLQLDYIVALFVTNGSTPVRLVICLAGKLRVTRPRMIRDTLPIMVVLLGICAPLGLQRKWNTTKRDAPVERDVRILHRVCLERGLSGVLRWKIRIPPSLCCPGTSGRWLGIAREFFELHISESPACPFFLQEARTAPHELRAMKHRSPTVGYFVLWSARRQLACIARHGLNLCQIRLPECVEGFKLGSYALQLPDTRVLLRNVHCPSEGPSERAKLEQELEGVDIALCFIGLW